MEKIYYNLQDPPTWKPSPEDLPADSGAVLLMRLSIRPPMIAGQFGTQIKLTPTGLTRAAELGEAWGPRILQVSSSSSLRCMKTGDQIIRGAGLKLTTLHNPALGEPGAFIENSQKAITAMEQQGPMELVNALLQEISIPGHLSVEEGTRIMLESFLSDNPPKGKIRVEITHDTILACMLYHLQGVSSLTEKDWPRMLEGILLWKEGQTIFWKWRGQPGNKALIP